jgi:hypothetical protein
MEFVGIVSAILFTSFNTVYKEACWVFIMFPIAAVPFLYVMSFIFPSVASA